MAEHLERKLFRLRTKLVELKQNLPMDNISFSTLLEIESLEREITFLSSDTIDFDINKDTNIN